MRAGSRFLHSGTMKSSDDSELSVQLVEYRRLPIAHIFASHQLLYPIAIGVR